MKLVLNRDMVISGGMDVVELSTGTKDGVCHRCERSLVRALLLHLATSKAPPGDDAAGGYLVRSWWRN